MIDDEEARMQADVTSALEGVMANSGLMLGKWIVCAEVYQPDGERVLWTIQPSDLTDWDRLGLLAYASLPDRP